jgi:hypothetical protein
LMALEAKQNGVQKHKALKEMGWDVFRRAQPSPDGRNEGFGEQTLNMQPSALSIHSRARRPTMEVDEDLMKRCC